MEKNRLISKLKSSPYSVNQARVAWLVAIVLGLIFVAASPFAMNPDGISYLHLADLYRSGNWSSAVDACWSPVYPLFLAVFASLSPSSPYWEAPIVHVANFTSYLLAFAAFRYFMKSVVRAQRLRAGDDGGLIDFTRPVGWISAHALFFVTALTWIGLEVVAPDMLLAAVLYASFGLALRLREHSNARTFVFLGALIGLGYLTKSVMFPLGAVFLIVASFTPASLALSARRFAFAVLGFMAVSTPQIVAVSRLVGHLSYADTGAMVLAREINLYPMFWIGKPNGSGTPQHPVRSIHEKPDAYEFAVGDASSSYPFWDRPAYWTAGIRAHADYARQLAVTMPIVRMYGNLFSILIVATLAMGFARRRGLSSRYLTLIVPSLAALAVYALVFAEPRYLAVWVVVLFIGLVASMKFTSDPPEVARAVLAAVTIVYGAQLVVQTFEAFRASDEYVLGEPSSHPQLEIVRRLKTNGISEGSRVASIGYAFNDYWARLGKMQVAMQTPQATEYWKASAAVKADVNESFRRAGAVAIVTSRAPAEGPGEGWISLGIENYYVFPLVRATASRTR